MNTAAAPRMVSAVDAAVEQYIAGVQQLLDFIEVGGANHGQVVQQILKHFGLEAGEPWCIASANYAGYRSFMVINPVTRERKSTWPLLRSASCASVAADAEKRGALMKRPKRGDVFVKYYPSLKRFAHAGVVLQIINDSTCLTIDGNTVTDAGDPYTPPRPANAKQDDREGWGQFVKKRTFTGRDRFIRWTQLMAL